MTQIPKINARMRKLSNVKENEVALTRFEMSV